MFELLGQLRVRCRAIWRRRWIVLLTAWLSVLAGSTFVMLMPDRYESSARIYVDTTSLMGPLLQGIAIQDDLSNQLRVMQATLLSRPNLLKVAHSVDLALEAENEQQLEGIVEGLQQRTAISMAGSELFRVSHVHSDPQLARDVVQALLTIFVESNLGENRAEMESARAFIGTQVAAYEERLREAEQEMAEFRAEHSDVLSPSGSFASRLESAREDVKNAALELEDLKEQRDRLVARLQETPQFLEFSAAQATATGSGLSRIQELQNELDQKRTIFSSSHPDIIALERQLNAAMERRDGASADAAVDAASAGPGSDQLQVPNPLHEEISKRVLDLEAQVSTGERRLAAARETQERLRQVASAAPQLEAQMADMNRDYEILKRNHAQLLDRSESARISQDARVDAESIRFRIVEPPEVPLTATGPNRMLFLVVVLIGSIGGGLGIGFILSETEQTFATPQNVREAFGLPVLGGVCWIPSPRERAAQFLDKVTISLGAGAMVAFTALLAVFANDIAAAASEMEALRQLGRSLIEGVY